MVFFAPQGKTYYNLDAESSCWRFSNEEQDPPPPFPLPDSSPSHPLSPILPLPLPFPSSSPPTFPSLSPLSLPFPSPFLPPSPSKYSRNSWYSLRVLYISSRAGGWIAGSRIRCADVGPRWPQSVARSLAPVVGPRWPPKSVARSLAPVGPRPVGASPDPESVVRSPFVGPRRWPPLAPIRSPFVGPRRWPPLAPEIRSPFVGPRWPPAGGCIPGS